ncbi:metal ABC transporter solute-binding protein, Zn/Mn family [Martelella alba]|uniref:Cation ABC transporter substrate-binding protein n=1 Tax=Martelella alba TaxID=2590451 RepID=A0ABY2SEF3_9HYPH|nr:zinc ABC transporter substrate-binding protein [Martelella alba]TKI03168.1 cation ABC transporter substrate-binding protein [Martelella alba]
MNVQGTCFPLPVVTTNTIRIPSNRTHPRWKTALFCTLLTVFTYGVGSLPAIAADKIINAVGVENEYADVISQIGGQYVHVATLISDPNTDPHTFEANPKIAQQIAASDIIVENGIGYDDWADKIISAAPKSNRKIINVQHLLNLPDSTPNPHLWYDPKTMPAVADAIAQDLAALLPSQARVFEANAKHFKASLQPWYDAMAAFKADYPNAPVAATEPVANFMLQAMGVDIKTPFSLQASIMNGTDPSPQDVSTQNALFTGHKVKVFAYNQQVTSPLTGSFLALAKKNHIPVVGVYETMPRPGYHYQSWMLAEVIALRKAVANRVSTETLIQAKQ